MRYLLLICLKEEKSGAGKFANNTIRREMKVIDEHLCQVQRADELDLQVLESLRAILEILNGFYEAEEA